MSELQNNEIVSFANDKIVISSTNNSKEIIIGNESHTQVQIGKYNLEDMLKRIEILEQTLNKMKTDNNQNRDSLHISY